VRLYAIPKQDIGKLVKEFSRRYMVIAPLKVGGRSIFGKMKDENFADVDLFGARPSTPPKSAVFPPFTTLFKFRKKGRQLELLKANAQVSRTILFGVKPCDVKGLRIFDEVFQKGVIDPGYKEIRDNLFLVSADCLEPTDYCFCSSFGISPVSTNGSDLHVSDLGKKVIINVNSNRGLKLLEETDVKLVKPTKAELVNLKVRRNKAERKVAAAQYQFDLPLIRKNIKLFYRHPFLEKLGPIWKELSWRCVECGGCVFSCPICHCHYIIDRLEGAEGERARVWDACLFEGYSRMAGGANPRPKLPNRLRQWYFCKFSYFPEQYRDFGCVGCGRCTQACFGRIDPREVLFSFTSLFKQLGKISERIITKYGTV